jgi:hypothetical protein
MDADAHLDAPVGQDTSVTFGDAGLHFNRASHGFDHAAEFDQCSITRAFDKPSLVERDRGIDEVDAGRPEARERALLIRASKPRVANPSATKIAASFRVSVTALSA